jgi:predicted dehydrogenase
MRPITRRDFMYDSAWLAAAVAAGGIAANVPSNADGAAAPSVPSRPGAAIDRLRVAVIGVNGQGMSHVRGYANKHNCVITTICDADSAVIGRAMKAVEKEQGRAPKYEQDIRKVVEDPNIDVVSIAMPNHWHALAAIWAMQNGKDVYVEKPVSHNVSEGRRMVEVARKTKRICQTGTQSRSAKGMREAIAYLRSGQLGQVKLARGLCYKLRPSIGKVTEATPVPKTVNYDLWCGPAPVKPLMRRRLHYDWHWVWDTGNGDLGNQGIHEMDKARWGLGKNALARSVQTIGGRFGYVDDGETPNTEISLFDYGDCQLLFEVRGWQSESPFPGKEAPKRKGRGGKGKMRGENFVGNVWYCSQGFLVCPSYTSGIAYSNDGEVLKRFTSGGDHFGNFIAAVRSRKVEDLNADILEGHLSSALCHLGNISYQVGTPQPFNRKVPVFNGNAAALKAMEDTEKHLRSHKIKVDELSYRLGRKLTLNVAAETFGGDRAANALLTREYRRGFVVPAKV